MSQNYNYRSRLRLSYRVLMDKVSKKGEEETYQLNMLPEPHLVPTPNGDEITFPAGTPTREVKEYIENLYDGDIWFDHSRDESIMFIEDNRSLGLKTPSLGWSAFYIQYGPNSEHILTFPISYIPEVPEVTPFDFLNLFKRFYESNCRAVCEEYIGESSGFALMISDMCGITITSKGKAYYFDIDTNIFIPKIIDDIERDIDSWTVFARDNKIKTDLLNLIEEVRYLQSK